MMCIFDSCCSSISSIVKDLMLWFLCRINLSHILHTQIQEIWFRFTIIDNLGESQVCESFSAFCLLGVESAEQNNIKSAHSCIQAHICLCLETAFCVGGLDSDTFEISFVHRLFNVWFCIQLTVFCIWRHHSLNKRKRLRIKYSVWL